MFKSPSGDMFQSKSDYQKWLGHVIDQRKRHNGEDVKIGATHERRNAHNGSCKKKSECPKCHRIDNLTRDWYGDLMCPDCYKNSL